LGNTKIINLLAVIIFSAAAISACSSPAEQEISSTSPSQVVLEESDHSLKAAPIGEETPLQSDQNEADNSNFETIVEAKRDESTITGDAQTGISGGSDPESLSQIQPTPTLDPSLPTAPHIGSVAPNFSLQTVNGDEVELHDLRGEAVMVNYWVTWCVPCIEEMPVLEKLHREYQDQGFTLLSVNGIAQDDMNKVLSTLGEFDITFPVALDKDDSVYSEFQVRFMPTSFFIDQQGVIQHIQLGSTTEEGFRSRIEDLLSDQL
jgi:peroxiredoxin